MPIGLISDAHGNPLGLRLALAALAQRGAAPAYFLGDAVGYFPGADETIRVLTEAGVYCIRGNHEAMLLGDLELDPLRDEVYGIERTRSLLSEAARWQLAEWPLSRTLEIEGRRILLVHGSPRDPLRDYVYPDSDFEWFSGLDCDAVFMGNTHRPFVARAGRVLIANVGSCGLPRDQGNLAACAVYDAQNHTCEILRVPMPPEMVLAQFESAAHPAVTECLYRTEDPPVGTVVMQEPAKE